MEGNIFFFFQYNEHTENNRKTKYWKAFKLTCQKRFLLGDTAIVFPVWQTISVKYLLCEMPSLRYLLPQTQLAVASSVFEHTDICLICLHTHPSTYHAKKKKKTKGKKKVEIYCDRITY